jgi:hypothetical protein
MPRKRLTYAIGEDDGSSYQPQRGNEMNTGSYGFVRGNYRAPELGYRLEPVSPVGT